MLPTESIAVPPERIPPIATDMASASKTVAGILFFVTFVVTIAAVGAVMDGKIDKSGGYQASSSAEAAGHAVGTVIGLGIFVAIPGLFALRAARNASRASRAARTTHDRSIAWRLSGKHLIAVDGRGVPHPELSFKLNAKLRTMLLALPRAELHS